MDESIVKHLVPADLDEPSRLLLKAADLIETRGHCKGIQEDEQGRLCAAGAISIAITGRTQACSKLYNVVAVRLAKAVGCEFGPAMWNNAPERTAEEVISTMRRVALGG